MCINVRVLDFKAVMNLFGPLGGNRKRCKNTDMMNMSGNTGVFTHPGNTEQQQH